MKKKKLKKKELAVRIKRLVDQFADLNNRLNRVSHDKLNQGLQLDQLSKADSALQQRLQEMQTQIQQLINQEEDLSNLLESLQLQTSEGVSAEEASAEQQQTQRHIDHLNEELASLHEQHQVFRQALESDSQSADMVANNTDDLRRDVAEMLSHIRRLEESGSELLVSDSKHEAQIQGLQNDIAELSQKLAQDLIERGGPQQDVTQLLQESAQPLRHEIEHLRHQVTEKGGQHKELERRLLELSNRIGETGARLESQQQDKARKSEVLENRLSKLETLVKDLEPVSNADHSHLESLEQKLDKVERDMQSLLTEKSSELATRLDSFDGALSEHAAKSESLYKQVELLNDDMSGNRHGLEERLASIDLRLSSYIDQQANLPDPLASIAPVIEEQKEKVEETVKQLKQEIGELQTKLQAIDTDEQEAADWLGSIATNLDQQAENREQLQQALATTNSDINLRLDEIKARLIITERQLKEQDEAAQDQLQKLTNLAEEVVEQGRHGVDLKLTTATLQEDTSSLQESKINLSERLDRLQQALQQEEQRQTALTQQLSTVEQEQKEIRELSDLGLDSLQERVKTALAQLAEQSGLNDGLTQRLDDLEVSLQEQFGNIESKHNRLLETESENQERLALQEQSNHTLSEVVTELRTDHLGLLEQNDKQKTFLEAMTSEYGKRQQESEQMTHRLGLLGTQVEEAHSSRTYHSMAIGGLLGLLLLSAILGYQYFSNKLGDVERDVSLELMQVSENYLTRNEIEELMNASVAESDNDYDLLAVEELINKQEELEQRLVELEQLDEQTPVQPDSQEETSATIDQAASSQPVQKSDNQALAQQPSATDAWRALRSRGGYTIQLIGVSSEPAIAAFASKHGLQNELAYITADREGKAWHILLYGMYDAYTDAAKALDNLPEGLKAQQPWIRKMPQKGTINRL
ncbi:MAG: SPOR domain-containing protein [Candidatus Thiodiazotropha sp.]